MIFLYTYLILMGIYYLVNFQKYMEKNSNKCYFIFHDYKTIISLRYVHIQKCRKCGKGCSGSEDSSI